MLRRSVLYITSFLSANAAFTGLFLQLVLFLTKASFSPTSGKLDKIKESSADSGLRLISDTKFLSKLTISLLLLIIDQFLIISTFV